MQPFDLTQCAYALETLLPGLREEDVRRQRLANLLNLVEPGSDAAVGTAVDACRLHVALQSVAALGDFLVRAAVYQDELLTLLHMLERGDVVRLAHHGEVPPFAQVSVEAGVDASPNSRAA